MIFFLKNNIFIDDCFLVVKFEIDRYAFVNIPAYAACRRLKISA